MNRSLVESTPETMVVEDETPNLGYLSGVYFTLQLAGGHIGLPLLVLIFVLSRRVQRPASIINFCLTWIIYSVSYTLLMYGGHHHNATSPPSKLCLTQSAMIHGAPPMAVVSALSVVLRLYNIFHSCPLHERLKVLPRSPRNVTSALLTILPPYLTFIAFATPAALLGLAAPSSVKHENGLYCSFGTEAGPFQVYAVPVFCAIVLSVIASLEITMIIWYWRRRIIIKNTFPLYYQRSLLSPLLRVSIFTFYTLVTFLVCISFAIQLLGRFPYMIQASLPLGATIMLGTQSDIYHLLFGWIYRPIVGREIEYVQGGGWSLTESSRLSSQLPRDTVSTTET